MKTSLDSGAIEQASLQAFAFAAWDLLRPMNLRIAPTIANE